jgi:hypothetical protein
MRMMFLISLLIIFALCVKKVKMSNKIRRPDQSSFLQITVKDSGPKIYDEVALDDKYENPDLRGRMQEDYMGDGKSEEELFQDFKKTIQAARPSYQFR